MRERLPVGLGVGGWAIIGDRDRGGNRRRFGPCGSATTPLTYFLIARPAYGISSSTTPCSCEYATSVLHQSCITEGLGWISGVVWCLQKIPTPCPDVVEPISEKRCAGTVCSAGWLSSLEPWSLIRALSGMTRVDPRWACLLP